MREDEGFQVIVPSRPEYVPILTEFLGSVLRTSPALKDARESFHSEVELILTEACTNAVRHAHGKSAAIPLKVDAWVDGDCLCLEIFDRGPGFELSSPTLPEDPLAPSGRGLFMIRKLSHEMTYEERGEENCLCIQKKMGETDISGP